MPKITNAKQKCVVDAARRLLATEGLHGLSIKLLVKESGVAAGTLYLHFKDKEDILRRVHTSILHEVAEAVSHNHDSDLPLFEQFHNLWRNLWAYFQEHPNTLMVKAQFDHLPKNAMRQDLEDARDAFKVITGFFEDGKRSGQIKDLPDEILRAVGFETCATLARHNLLGLIDMNDEMLEKCISASWQAIAAPCQPLSKTEKQL